MKTTYKKTVKILSIILLTITSVACGDGGYYGTGDDENILNDLDGAYIRKEYKYGDKLYYIDGNYIRKEYKYGDKLYYIDGNYICKEYKYGDKLYYIDGDYIRKEYKYGDKLYYIDK